MDNQQLFTLLFMCLLVGGLSYFCGWCLGFSRCAELINEKYNLVEKVKNKE